jgi:hypothetical protein
MTTVFIDPEALATAARAVQREWGETGYTITAVNSGPRRSVLLTVEHSDGSVFHVGGTRYGQTVWHEQPTVAAELLAVKVREESVA